jgi:dethiobiotin synthetase
VTELVARPARLVYVAGTGTDVGKTWWTAALARHLRACGLVVAARKPVQSCGPDAPTDADALAAATGETPDTVTPPTRTYRLAWAPPMAARELERPAFTITDLARETVWPPRVDVGLVEGVGGPRSPVASDGDNVALAHALGVDHVVLVADAGLGTINAVRLSAEVFGPMPVVVALNRFTDDALPARNLDLLRADGYQVVTSPEHTLDGTLDGVLDEGR